MLSKKRNEGGRFQVAQNGKRVYCSLLVFSLVDESKSGGSTKLLGFCHKIDLVLQILNIAALHASRLASLHLSCHPFHLSHTRKLFTFSMSSFNPPESDRSSPPPTSEPSGLAGLASRFVAYRDQQDQHSEAFSSDHDDHDEVYEDNDSSEDSNDARGVDPNDPSLGLVERLLAARARSNPEQADKITSILNSLNLGIDFTPKPRVLKTHVFGEVSRDCTKRRDYNA